MHDGLAERHQLQRLDELLARNVLAEEATRSRLKGGKDVGCGVSRGENDSFYARVRRHDIPHQIVRGRAAFVNPYEPDTHPPGRQQAFGFLIERSEYLDRTKGRFA